jgi:hypothetical protein
MATLFRVLRENAFELGVWDIRRRGGITRFTVLAGPDQSIQLSNCVCRGHACFLTAFSGGASKSI